MLDIFDDFLDQLENKNNIDGLISDFHLIKRFEDTNKILPQSGGAKTTYIDKVNKYYRHCKKKISSTISLNKDYKYVLSKNDEQYIIKIFNENKLILIAEYDIAGMYNIHNSVWYWGWNIDSINKKLVERIKKVKQFSKYVRDNYDKFSAKEKDELYFRTNNDNYYTSIKNIDYIMKLAMYITRSIWYIPLCYNKDNTITKCEYVKNKPNSTQKIEYIFIKKIIKVY